MTRPAMFRRFGIFAVIAALATVTTVSAHPHEVTKGNGEVVVIANGQNHPGFTKHGDGEDAIWESCEGLNLPGNEGPAGYGLETAHHGPDKGKPGKADGCFATDKDPTSPEGDRNPAID